MARIKRFDKSNKDYYLSELDDRTLKARAIVIRVAALAAAAAYVPFIVLYAAIGFSVLPDAAVNYSGLSAYVALTFALPVALVWCAVFSFLSYTPKRETLVRKTPALGFKAIPYFGQVIALLLALGFAIYHSVLCGAAGSLRATDIAALALLWLTAALTAVSYIAAFVTYRACVLIEVEPDEDEENDVALPTFRLSEEELELGKSAFAPAPEKKKKRGKNAETNDADGADDTSAAAGSGNDAANGADDTNAETSGENDTTSGADSSDGANNKK